MAPPRNMYAETQHTRGPMLNALLGMYAEQRRIYGKVLDLSRRQTEMLREGSDLAGIRDLLLVKRDYLTEVAGIEREVRDARSAWDESSGHWTGDSRSCLHQALQEVSDAIEEILLCEEINDRVLLEQVGTG